MGKNSTQYTREFRLKVIKEAFQNHQGSIQRSFAKCGIALPQDGSRDSEINIEGLRDYSIPSSFPESSISPSTLDTAENQWIPYDGLGEFDT